MSVVNVKVKCIRPKYNNLHEWMSDPNNVYIGRRGIVFINGQRYPAQDSIWANPFKIDFLDSRDDVIRKYEEYLRIELQDGNLKAEFIKLKNKRLGCWCSPEKCHGDIIIKILSELT